MIVNTSGITGIWNAHFDESILFNVSKDATQTQSSALNGESQQSCEFGTVSMKSSLLQVLGIFETREYFRFKSLSPLPRIMINALTINAKMTKPRTIVVARFSSTSLAIIKDSPTAPSDHWNQVIWSFEKLYYTASQLLLFSLSEKYSRRHFVIQ